mmetsp:Transcript_15137/g.31197  ORF Transcript_15137/g.31197 Transcript_15137/m.31197 type:complete len:383 (+) Transcript_15137:1576-2724(+)
MVDVHLLPCLLHGVPDVLDLLAVKPRVTRRREHELWVGLINVLSLRGVVPKPRLGILLVVLLVLPVSLPFCLSLESGRNLCLLDEVLPVIRVGLVLCNLQALEERLKHLEGAKGTELESDGGKQLLRLELVDDAVQLLVDVKAVDLLKRRGVKAAPQLLVGCWVLDREIGENLLKPVLVQLGLGQADPFLDGGDLLLLLVNVSLALPQGGEEGVGAILAVNVVGEELLKLLPKVHHIAGGHTKSSHESLVPGQPLHGHGGNGVELGQLEVDLGLAVKDGGVLLYNVALKVDKPSKVLRKKDVVLLFVGILGIRGLDNSQVFVPNKLKPVPKLDGVSNGGGKGQDGTASGPDDALQGVSLGSVQGVDLIQHHVLKVKASVQHH